MTKKKNINLSGLEKNYKTNLQKASEDEKIQSAGIAGEKLQEPTPNYIARVGDIVKNNGNNSWIILGRDRAASRLSGYGGLGDTQAGAIDLVVGLMNPSPKDGYYVDPNFEKDAARIYISQKTDIDKNFKLVGGSMGESEAFSGIGIKADAVRIIGRQGIKLVTGVDEKNSKDSKIKLTQGIELIAGNNDEDIQPIPKGDFLSESLEELSQIVEKLSGIVSTFLKSQMEFNNVAAIHYHYSPFYGIPTLPSEELGSQSIDTSLKQVNDCLVGLVKFKVLINAYKNTYLRIQGDKYINSRYNKVN